MLSPDSLYSSQFYAVESQTYTMMKFGYNLGETEIWTEKRVVGRRSYDITDHLGNVRAVVSDVKREWQGELFTNLRSTAHYYPFGMQEPLRTWQTNSYRYGYQGQEKDDELSGSGNHYTAEFWEYDPRVGRRWNTDPKPNPSIGSYTCFQNNPVLFSDILGDSVDVGNLLEKNNKGELKYRQSVQFFETFLKTERGIQWLKDRAQKGFKYQGQIDKSININITEDGVLSTAGIDYKFYFDNNGGGGGSTLGLFEGGRLKNLINLGAIDHQDGTSDGQLYNYYDFSLEKYGTFLHEAFYHGYNFERVYLLRTYQLANSTENFANKEITGTFISPYLPIDHQHYTGRITKLNFDANRDALKNSLFGKYAYCLLRQTMDNWNLSRYKDTIPMELLIDGMHNYYDYKSVFKKYFRK